MNDTIFALATAAGRAAVAVMRLSGPQASRALMAMGASLPAPRLARTRRLIDPKTSELIDQALVLWMPGPASFTGEDVVELHLHGGRAVVAAAARALTGLGLRPAAPGEFTRRAFEHGRLDLSEAEAIADLVDAETTAQHRQALAQLGGSITRKTTEWRAAIIETLAGLEAAIDFPDEDLPETVLAISRPPLMALSDDLRTAAADVRGERVRDGFQIALIGAPNAGKSSLLNLLSGRDAAIVTDIAGTTRDVIEVVMDMSGYRVLLADTAGVRESAEVIEQEGVRRARRRAHGADLRLWVVDQSGHEGAWQQAAGLVQPGDILILMKVDLTVGPDASEATRHAASIGATALTASCVSGDVMNLLAQLNDKIAGFMAGNETPTLSRERHRAALAGALGHVDRALQGSDPELVAEDVRLAARELERITGRIDSEAVLDRVFAAFCIGK